MAHVDLAKAEAAAIGGQIARVAALGALAFVLVSSRSSCSSSASALCSASGSSDRWAGAWSTASRRSCGRDGRRPVAVGISAAGSSALAFRRHHRDPGRPRLGLDLPNRLYAAIGEALASPVDPGVRPLVVGVLIGVLVWLVVGHRGWPSG